MERWRQSSRQMCRGPGGVREHGIEGNMKRPVEGWVE